MRYIPSSRFPTNTLCSVLDKSSLDSLKAADNHRIQNFVDHACAAVVADTWIARRTTISPTDQQRTSNEKWWSVVQRSVVARIAKVLAKLSEVAVELLGLAVEPFVHKNSRDCTDLDEESALELAVGNFELAGEYRTGLHLYRILGSWELYSTTAVALLALVAGEVSRMDWTLLSAIFAVDHNTFVISSDDQRFELVEEFAVRK